MRTPEEAASLLCPFARCFAAPKAETGCKGPACMLWRWERITTTHPLWLPAVRTVAAQIGDTSPYAKASKIVAADLEAHGMIPTHGYCGAGGE